MEALRECVNGLNQKISESMGQTPEAFHFDNLELRNGELYYTGKGKGKDMLLTTRGGKLRSVGEIVKTLGKDLHKLGFNVPMDGKVMAQQAIMLNRVQH